MEITRDEFEARHGELKKDINSLGQSVKLEIKEHKIDVREDFKSVWKAIDMMLFKVGVVVTICSAFVMFIFKAIEVNK